jgi:DNA replication and repair protein RecF
MYLTHLALTHFRNYARLEIDLQARIHVLQGENAQGKTNLLEAIYYLATTRSPLASSDRELIAWAVQDEVIPHAHLAARYIRGGEEHRLDAALVLERQPGDPLDRAAFRRQIRADGVPRRAMDIVGRLNAVLFLPEDIALVSGSPGGRRRYLDVTLCQVDPVYCRALSRYNRVLTQRNALLRTLREGRSEGGELAYWDAQLAQLGAVVLSRRLWATHNLGRQGASYQKALTGQQESLRPQYVASFDLPGRSGQENAPLPEEPLVREALAAALRRARSQEIARGVTVVGPHRDDLRLYVNDVDMTVYGSRGQQRTVALALKLAEVAFIHEQTGEAPVLLLDDVVSELDQRRSRFLLGAIGEAQQVLITTTTLGGYPTDFLERAVCWRVSEGALTPLD